MASLSDFPGNLSTNICILYEFLDVAYIVCTGAIPASADKNSNIQEINSKERVLARLKNAEQQFRHASILVALDPDKLELFTFYKKVDIVKDQKTILTKFGQVCKLNHCIIAYKNACRVVDILKPDALRIYKLFTTAVLSSIRLQAPQGGKVVRVGTSIYLVRSVALESKEYSIIDVPQRQYSLQKVDLQITAGGQLLLVVRKALWPTLLSVTDLITLPKFHLLDRTDMTCYLIPTGQLALYRGGWVGSLTTARKQLEISQSVSYHEYKRRIRFIEKTQEWIANRSSSVLHGDTTWIEVDLPALVRADDEKTEKRELIWKSIYWPVQMSYVFSKPFESHINDFTDATKRDSLRAAEEWFSHGASQAQQAHSELQSVQQVYQDTEDRLFDDDVHFDSPQHFMSYHPLQGMSSSQMVYPTPPDVMTAQPTPGFTTIDGIAQTPMTVHHLQPSIHQSSPLANVTDAQPNPSSDQTIPDFLSHSEEEDLFEEMDDQKLVPTSFADEPNWDFFDRDSPSESTKVEGVQKAAPDEPIVVMNDVNVAQNESPLVELENQSNEQPQAVESKSEIVEGGADSEHRIVNSPQNYSTAPQHNDKNDLNPPHTQGPNEGLTTIEDISEAITQHGKRRRSSVYDVEVRREHERDLKYSANGKYWFDRKGQPPFRGERNTILSYSRQLSPDSSSSYSSSQDECITDEDDNFSKVQKPWAQYDATVVTKAGKDEAQDYFNVTECDTELEHLLKLVWMASGDEPFITPMPEIRPSRMPSFEDPDRSSMVVQIINEHLAQSGLFRTNKALSLPEISPISAMEMSFDNAGSNATLTNAPLNDLVALQPANTQVKPNPKLMALDRGRIRLRQADKEITADLSIIRYWELLNLQPLHGKKDILAICIHPDNEFYTEGCRSFLQRLGETYNNCNLGTHEVADLENFVEAGLAGWQSWPDRTQLLSLCQNIGKVLGEYDGDQDCTVIYIVVPDDELSNCYTICDAFVELFETFVENRISGNMDVTLQLIPGSFVADPDTLAVPPEEQYVGLVLEVYSRIPSAEVINLPGASASAFELDKPAHPLIQFELDSKIVSPLQRYGSCCHLAYSVSSDRKWLVATWSDNIGTIALTMAYSLLSADGKPTRLRIDIFKHLAETSTQLMNRQKSKWWLAIVKTDVYDVDEFQEWLYTCGQLSDEQSLLSRVVLLSVELQPRICLHGAGTSPKQAQSSAQVANTSSTPVTTPQATTSPDQIASITPSTGTNIAAMAQTPPDSNTEASGDHEIYLVDPLEDSWMATFSFGMNQSSSSLNIRPSLAGGLLVKRLQPEYKNGSDVTTLGVNLLAVTRKPSIPLMPLEREHILQDVFVQYRGLHTLAVAKGHVDPSKSCVPWHIASSYKGANVLESILS